MLDGWQEASVARAWPLGDAAGYRVAVVWRVWKEEHSRTLS